MPYLKGPAEKQNRLFMIGKESMENNKPTINIIVPVMNEEEVLPLFYDAIKKVSAGLPDYDTHYIFVDDGSKDGTLAYLKIISETDEAVKYISFSRNFGKEAAIFAGLKNSFGDFIILMDGDLEHPPELIPQMLEYVKDDEYQACGAKREVGMSSSMFNTMNNKLSPVKLKKGATDYMCMSRKFVDAVLSLSENQRFTKGLFAWVGFNVKWIDYEQPTRPVGRSKWNVSKLTKYAIDGITSFSTVPLQLVTWAGSIICILAFIYIIVTIIKTCVTGIDVPGYVTTLVVLLFLGGIILLAIGILGSYIGRIYMESKDRPIYIANQTNINKPKDKDTED